MEKALFISSGKGLPRVDPEYTRLYFGAEFCERLIPSRDEIRAAAGFAAEHKLGFTLVTPYVTDRGLDALAGVIDALPADVPAFEVVINDWGVLRMLRGRSRGMTFVLGRLLTKQKRDPRTAAAARCLPPQALGHFRESNVDTAELRGFLSDLGIRRVELDNTAGGIERQKDSLPASLYVPFAYVTTTRFCPAASCTKQAVPLRSIAPCAFECRSYTFALRHGEMPGALLLKGNTQFFRNDRLPDNMEELNIDRIVYEPELPI